MKKLLVFLLIILSLSLLADSRYFSKTDIPFRHKMEPFLENHLENYLTPHAVKGDFWFVDAGITTGIYDGKSWANAFTNLSDAITAAGNDDVIFIAPGDYLEGATIAITENNLKIIGLGNFNSNSVLIYNSTDYAAYDLMTINANNVEISGIGFTTVNDSCSAIKISTTASKYKAWIHDCRFDGYGAGEYAIHTGTTYDSPDLLVENCLFRSFTTAAIYANATRGYYSNNTFHIDASSIGIELVPTTGSRPDQIIAWNSFLGANSSDVGIKITNSPSAGTYLIIHNVIANCATTITSKATNDAACILNYTGNTSGGVLIDPSP